MQIKRVYGKKDADKCDELLMKLIAEETGEINTLLNRFYRYGLADGKNILLCYVDDNKIVGYIYAKETFAYEPQREYLIDALYIEPEYRNKGLGRELMSECMKILHEMNIPNIMINVMSNNYIAKKLYSSLGFYTVRETMRWLDD